MVDMATSLSQCFMWIIEYYNGVVATQIKYYAPSVFTKLLIYLLKFLPFH